MLSNKEMFVKPKTCNNWFSFSSFYLDIFIISAEKWLVIGW